MIRLLVGCLVLSFGLGGAGFAAEAVTVQILLDKGFVVAGVIPSAAGPGLFLVKGKEMYFCNVAETPGSASVKTNYCKPVS